MFHTFSRGECVDKVTQHGPVDADILFLVLLSRPHVGEYVCRANIPERPGNVLGVLQVCPNMTDTRCQLVL